MKVAIMQPYFYPYAGYFRLLAEADLFVIYDCVQFPRRGWVHRNRLPDQTGQPQWITLPLQKCPQTTRIRDLCFQTCDGTQWWHTQLQRFPQLQALPLQHQQQLCEFDQSVTDYLIQHLRYAATALQIECPMCCSSELDIDPTLRAQDRIIAICQALHATQYLNAPGGRDLYDTASFAQAGLQLCFLDDYQGDYCSMLQQLSHNAKDPKHALIS